MYPLQATDGDSGDFGTVRYSLSGTTKFSIASDTGIISLLSPFNRSLDSKYNVFDAIASDNPAGSMGGSNIGSASVQVRRMQDNEK